MPHPSARRTTGAVAALTLGAALLAACSGSTGGTATAANITTITTAWPADVTAPATR